MPKSALKTIHLISDSTGELGERFTNALMSQFPKNKIVLSKFSFVEDEREAKRVMDGLLPQNCVLFHTVVSPKLKRTIARLSRAKKIPCFDLTGPPTDFLTTHLKTQPVWDSKAIHPINEEYARRVEAIEFTINHDDGIGVQSLESADVVLVGPSRTSKTPTSMYLAMKGCCVANIPIVPSVPVPEELVRLKGDPRVFGFTIRPEKLREIRFMRGEKLGGVPGGYTDLETIYKEIEWANKIYLRHQWKMVDVSERAVEETAALILKTLKR